MTPLLCSMSLHEPLGHVHNAVGFVSPKKSRVVRPIANCDASLQTLVSFPPYPPLAPPLPPYLTPLAIPQSCKAMTFPPFSRNSFMESMEGKGGCSSGPSSFKLQSATQIENFQNEHHLFFLYNMTVSFTC